MAGVRARLDRHMRDLGAKLEMLLRKAKEEQSIGDRHFWPIYNLDIKNPNTAEEETHDPDKLLAKYKAVLSEIDKTQSRLRAELSSALGHHFGSEETD